MTEDPDSRSLAAQWREARQALLDAIERLPESRISRATERAGWTLRHELAALASVDRELAHLLDAARHGAVDLDTSALRRLRGEAMHAAQELRLAPLRDHLADAGERTARALEGAGDALAASVTLAGREATTMAEHVRAQLARARSSVEVLGRYLD